MAQDIKAIETAGNRWTKHGKDRIYLDEETIAELLDGETSHNYIYGKVNGGPIRIRRMNIKFFYDLLAGQWVVLGTDYDSEIAAALTEHFETTDDQASEISPEPATEPAAPAAPVAEHDSTAPLATEKQVSYIMRLVDRGAHEEGGFISGGPTTIDEVRKMTRREASDYIDSLTSNY